MDIRGILFDSGDTLVFPKSGSWWPGPDFESILRQYGIDIAGFEPDIMKLALDEGYTYLNHNHLVTNLEEEKEQFRTYYRIICEKLGIIKEDELIEDLMRAYVEKCNFELYPDTVPVLEKLTDNGVILGIISDAWPSLHNKYITLGIRHYFKSFTVSAEVGCCKPEELIYGKAIDEIGIVPESLLFVDDDLDNVQGAIRTGMNGIVMLRNEGSTAREVPYVRDLNDILDIIR